MKNVDFRICYGARSKVDVWTSSGDSDVEVRTRVDIPINEILKTLIWELRLGKAYQFSDKDLLADLYLELKKGIKQ